MTQMLKYAILSLSLLTIISTSAVSPALAEMADYFSSAEIFLVQLVVVLHAFAIVPSLLAAIWLAERFSRKKVLLAGLLTFTVSGILGGAVSNIYVLLALRLILGVSLGMVVPFSTSLIADFFDEGERQKMLGLSTSLNMIGGMFALILSGYLTLVSWRLPFLIYLCGLPVFFLILRALPDDHGKSQKATSASGKFPTHVYKVAFIMLLFSILFFVITPTMALFLKNNGLGDSRMAGFAIAFTTLFGATSGFVLPRTLKITGRFFMPVMLFIISAGFLFLYFSTFIGMVFIGASLIGFSNRSIYPIFFYKATQGVPSEYSIRATAIVSATIYLGQFLAPIFQKCVGTLFQNPSTRFLYLFVAITTIVSAIFVLLKILFQKKAL